MKIYTKTGDEGETSLFGGRRVSKSDARVDAYGHVDELNAVLGAAAAAPPEAFEHDLLVRVQRDLFAIGGRLASPEPDRVAKALEKAVVPHERIEALEQAIDRMTAHAESMGADAIVGVRFTTSAVMQGAAELLAYGTAVKLKPKS